MSRAETKLVILESHAGRFCILVCEDLDHLLEFGTILREVGVSHALNPITFALRAPFERI